MQHISRKSRYYISLLNSLFCFEFDMRKVAIFLFFLFCFQISSGQFHSFTLRNYKAIDGLPQSQVSTMLEDKNGYLWIGTEGGGLARFDGREFKVYTTFDGLASNLVSHIRLDKNDNLWIVHPRAITKFDGVKFTKFVQRGTPGATTRLRRIFELNDTLFFTSAPGNLGKIYKDSVYYWSKPVKDNAWINFVHPKGKSELLMLLSDSTFLVCGPTAQYEIPFSNTFKDVYGISNYRNETLIRTEKGFYAVDFSTNTFVERDLPIRHFILAYDSVHDVFWTRTENALLKEKIQASGKVQVDTVLKDVGVNLVVVDSEGNTWFGTDGSGLYKYFIQDFDRCGSDEMKTIMAIQQDKQGANWIGSMTKGLWRIKDGKVKHFYDKNESYRNFIVCLHESNQEQLWVGTAFGLGLHLREKDSFKWFTRRDGLSGETILGLSSDSGGLWIGTSHAGVNYYDGKSFRVYTVKDGLPSNAVNAIHYSNHYKKTFVGNEFGLSTISSEGVEHLALSGIENATIQSIHSFRDSLLLLGSGGAGITIYNPRTRGKKQFTTHDGMASDFVYFVAADADDYIWIGSEKGITRLMLDSSLQVIQSRHFDYENGLTGVETNQNAFYFGRDEKYFGLIDGLYQFNDVERATEPIFDLHLTNIEVSYGQFSARRYADSLTGFFKIPVNPQLPPDHNHITFHFNRVNKTHPKSIKFKYQLENFDKTWMQPTSLTKVTYSNLPPGEYVFRVASTNSEGAWSESVVSYPFTVKAPFYQTASFLVGVFILTGGLITLILYIRVKQRIKKVMMLERIRIKEQENLRKEIARDFHDEMGNQLTRIINYVSLLKLSTLEPAGHERTSESANPRDLYKKVEDSAKYLYSGTRDFIWSIDPVNDELCKLFIHIRDFGEKLFEEKDIRFRAFNEIKEQTKLPYGFSREANLIFKEAMTNAFKYSNATNVSLTLWESENGFEMSFEDDGVGFYTGDLEKSNGLKNIRTRAERIKSLLRIQSVKNVGTKITLNFRLKKSKNYGVTI